MSIKESSLGGDQAMTLRFETCEFDSEQLELRRSGGGVAAMAESRTARYLLANKFVSETALARSITEEKPV